MNTARLARTSLAATLALVVVGGFTRGSGSGYGCADRWPLCERGLLGGLLPRLEYHMIIEWSHRWLAALVGLLVVATAVFAWRERPRRSLVAFTVALAVVVVGVQAWVGRLVVEGQLAGDLVVLHLTISMMVVMLLTVAVVATSGPSTLEQSAPRSVAILAIGAAGSLALLLLGSAVHNIYFPGWPLVFGDLVPDLSNSRTLAHFLHRVVAGVMAGYLVWVAVRLRRVTASRLTYRLVHSATGILAVNIAIGAAHVVTRVGSAGLVALHLGLGALTWSLLVAATTDAWLAGSESPIGAGVSSASR